MMLPDILESASRALAPAVPLLVDTALKGGAIIVVAAIVAWLLRRRSAAARHATWTVAIVAQLLLPVLAYVLPTWGTAVITTPAWMIAESPAPPTARPASRADERATVPEQRASTPLVKAEGVTPTSARQDRVTGITDAPPTASPSPAVSRSTSPLVWVAIVWALGFVLVLARLAAGTVGVARLARKGELVDDGAWLSLTQKTARALRVLRPTTLLSGGGVGVPVTWGVVYPIVLLPNDAAEWPEERRRYVLVHELAHVKRLDALTQLIAQIVAAIFWFNPLVWLAAHRMRVEREHACDDYVIREGTMPSRYAHDLLDLVRQLGTPAHASAPPAFAALAMARRSEFEGRMLAILDPVQDRHTLSRRHLAMLLALAALFVIPLAGFHPIEPQDTRVTATAREVAALTPITGSTPERPAPTTTTPRLVAADPSTSRKTSSESSASSVKSCNTWETSRSHGTSRHVHSNSDDDEGMSVDYLSLEPSRCAEARIRGRVTLTDDDTDVASLSPDGMFSMRERNDAHDRRLVIRERGGQLERAFSSNGTSAPYDETARRWAAGLMLELARELSIDAPKRIRRLRARGGVDAVLGDIRATRSSGAKSTAYTVLIQIPELTADDRQRVLREVASEKSMSSGDLSSVLRRLKSVSVTTPTLRSALGEALERVASSGDRKETLLALAPTADRELLLVLARVASGLPSSGDKARFLIEAAPLYLTKSDDGLRREFFNAVASIPSSGDHTRVLLAAVDLAEGKPSVIADILTSSTKIASSGDKTRVLVSAASQSLVTTTALRERYVEAAGTIPSSGDYRRAIEALLNQCGDSCRDLRTRQY